MTQTQTAVRTTPLEKILNSFPDARLQSSGWYLNPDNPRIGFSEGDDGKVRVSSFTGRLVEQALAMGKPALRLADLYPDREAGSYRPAPREKQFTLLDFAEYLRLDPVVLFSYGCRDGYTYLNRNHYRTVCIKLGGYCDPEGNEHSKVKARLSIDGKVRFLWDQNTPGAPIPCGLHRLSEAREKGYLILGEGESDAYTMWWHGEPFVGISGADAYKSLDVSLLHDIPRVYIIEEPDQAQKNQEQGRGFYANMRQHLRDGGYIGEIYSIRWKQATGYKDPSNLHKSIYNACHTAEERPHRAEVRAKFAEAIEKARACAIPEGNSGLETQEETRLELSNPPNLENESDLKRWLKDLLTVPQDTLSPAHKIVLMTIFLYSPMFCEQGQFWWKVDAAQLAIYAGMPKKTFLKHLTYFTDNVRLFTKKHRTIFYTPEGAPTAKRLTELSLAPAPGAYLPYPLTYKLAEGVEERQHGGPGRNDSGKALQEPGCYYCGSRELDIHEAQYCRTCHEWHIKDIAVAPLSEHPETVEQTAECEPAAHVTGAQEIESTAVVLPVDNADGEDGEGKIVRKNSTENPTWVSMENIYTKNTQDDFSGVFFRSIPLETSLTTTAPPPSDPPPDRQPYCHQSGWIWTGPETKYKCAECWQQREQVQA